MKLATLLTLSMATGAFAQTMSQSSCDILEKQIQDTLKYESLSIRNTQREILRSLTPELDYVKLSDLQQAVKDTEYSYDDEVISYSEKAEFKSLRNLKEIERYIPTDEEIARHDSLLYKSDASQEDLKELQRISKKIRNAKVFGHKKLTVSQNNRYQELSDKMDTHMRREKLYAQAQLNLNNYIRTHISKSVRQNAIIKEGSFGDDSSYEIEGQYSKIRLDEFDLKNHNVETKLDGFLGESFLTGRVYFDLRNYKGDKTSKRSYDFSASGKKIALFVGAPYVRGDNELNNAVKSIVLSEEKTWSDFGNESLDSSYTSFNYGISKNITDIGIDVRTVIDSETNELSVGFRTQVSNKDDRWATFPEEYTSLENMAKLLLPSSCKDTIEVKESVKIESNDTERESSVKKKGFFKSLFGKKKGNKVLNK